MTDAPPKPPKSLLVEPIGYVRTGHVERQSAPRQPAAAKDTKGRIELLHDPRYEHALEDLDSFTHIWVLFWFHLNNHFKAKVAPPRSERKRGVFATRAPYRPNPIGMSLVRLDRIEGRTLYVRDLDILDGTPVLDIKPYLVYADRAEDANSGWLANVADPIEDYKVQFSTKADEQLAFLAELGCTFLRDATVEVLRLGPAPHPYRRIRRDGNAMRLAVKDFRLRFRAEGKTITVLEVQTGYKRKALLDPEGVPTAETPLEVHRAFVERYSK